LTEAYGRPSSRRFANDRGQREAASSPRVGHYMAGPHEGARQGQGVSVLASRWARHSAVVNEKGFP
jgi:hypothetical protein